MFRNVLSGIGWWMTPGVVVLAVSCLQDANADLVAHFDPNVMASIFQDGHQDTGGDIPVTGYGDYVGWMSDARSPTPGRNDNAHDGWVDIQQVHIGSKSTWVYHPSGGVLAVDGDDNLLCFDDDTGGADGIKGALDTNIMQLILVGNAASGGSGTDYFIDLLDSGVVGGFSLRYNYDILALEGIVRGQSVVSTPINAGDYFVANLVWDGTNTSAELNITTLGGSVSVNGTPANNDAIDHTRFRIGEDGAGNQGIRGFIGDVYLFNNVTDQSSLVAQLADDYLVVPELVVDRSTGNISIQVPAGQNDITNVVGYKITSASDTLDPGQWLSIADNYDAGSPGPNQRDPDNNWVELTLPSSRNNLSEAEFEGNGASGSNGADFLDGTSTNLGNAWIQFYIEDLGMELLLDDGSVIPLVTRFVGNDGEAFKFGDLDFDGDIDADDFHNVFVPHYGTDTSSFMVPEQYQTGDLDNSGAVTLEDFLIFNDACLTANPGATPLSLGSVPEPNTSALVVLCGILAAVCRLLYGRLTRVLMMAGVLVTLGCLAPTASATIGGVLDMDFEFLTAGSTLNDASLIIENSGNNYYGFWGGGSGANGTPVFQTFGHTTAINNEDTTGYIILRDDRTYTGHGISGVPDPFTTPTPYFSLEPSTSYTFEAVLNWNGDNQARDGIMGQTGSDEWWIRENNGFLEYVFDDGPNRHISTGIIDISGLVNNSDWHHLGITFARDSGNPTQVTITSYFDYQQIHQELASVPLEDVGVATEDIRLGGYNTTATNWFDGWMDHFRISDEVVDPSQFLPIPEAPEYTLQINTDTGAVSLINETGYVLDINAYRITSAGNSLNPAGWNSLDNQDYDGSGSWTELGTTAGELSEGFLGGHSMIATGTTIQLGSAYNTTVDVRDIAIEFHLPSAAPTLFFDGIVEYVTGVETNADFDGDGDVDGADFLSWQLGFGMASPTHANGDANFDGQVDATDIGIWKSQFGTTGGSSGLGSTAAVPEPATAMLGCLALLLGVGLIWIRRVMWCRLGSGWILLESSRGRRPQGARIFPKALRVWQCGSRRDSPTMLRPSSALGIILLCASVSFANVTIERDYRLGDAPEEGAYEGGMPLLIWDSAGTDPAEADRQHLDAFGGTYVNVSDRPGAASGSLGIEFNAGSSESLQTSISMNAPSDMWDDTIFFPAGQEFPHNYENIYAHGMQLWAKPDITYLGQAVRQNLIMDTEQHGFFITNTGTWGLQYDNASNDSGIAVDTSGLVGLWNTNISCFHRSVGPFGDDWERKDTIPCRIR
ncbi:MAG: hypothetical protein JW829_10455 [Pirellulales bacterium]|nr:hypothetical protein [Pirellulales bacterium]